MSALFNLGEFSAGLIGAGKVGGSIAELLARQYKLEWLVVRNRQKTPFHIPFEEYSVKIYKQIDEIESVPEFIFICVGDGQIREVSEALAKTFGKELSGAIVAHVSGFRTADELTACADCGAATASFHPYQTFSNVGITSLDGVFWGVESDWDMYPYFRELSKFFSGDSVYLKKGDKKRKALYHISAVAASNFTTAALALSRNLAESCDLPAIDIIEPILRQTVNNSMRAIKDNSPPPLTGPVGRADCDSILRHMEALAGNDAALRAYIDFSAATAEMAKKYKIIDEDSYIAIKKALNKK